MNFSFLPNNGAYSDLFRGRRQQPRRGGQAAARPGHRFRRPEDEGQAPGRLEDIAASLVHLRDISREPLQSCWNRIDELESEGDRVNRRALADLYAFSDDDDSLARHVLTWKDIVDELERAMDGLEHVADAVESIVLKNA